MQKKTVASKISFAGILVAMGVVYGDIGTSPLYVMKAIVSENGGFDSLNTDYILGTISLIFWTLTVLTTIKYVYLALNADNHGEGGIFALYSLVKKRAKWLIIPAMIGGAALLADGVLTPAVTVTTAIEGLRDIPEFYEIFGNDQRIIIVITLTILLFLFSIQRFGTDFVGKAFGPVMFLWFTFLGGIGLLNMFHDFAVIKALNPWYAIQTLISPDNKLGLFILGNIFLATTGAEALYSDMGHVGKYNIRISWPYVKICLMLNYFGQAAWLLKLSRGELQTLSNSTNPFFAILPHHTLIIGVCFATIAAIIASQALISGSFTLVSEAIKLKLLPRLKIVYPGQNIGQMYIPAVNFILWLACSLVVLGFQTSAHMEAAYGLSITVTMLMTTLLLLAHLLQAHYNKVYAYALASFFLTIEFVFFLSSLIKFFHGGYVAVMLALCILGIMIVWEWGNHIEAQQSEEVHLREYIHQLAKLKNDNTLPLYQTNVVFLVPRMNGDRIGHEFIYSILDKRPKRACVYWFINVEVTDEPYTREFQVDMMDTDFIVNLKLYLGFRIEQEVNVYIREVIKRLMAEGRLPIQPQRYSISPDRLVGDFQFILIQESLSRNTEMKKLDRQVMSLKLMIKKITMSPEHWFGLENSEVKYETVPLTIGKARNIVLHERF